MLQKHLSYPSVSIAQIITYQKFFSYFYAQSGSSQIPRVICIELTANVVADVHISILTGDYSINEEHILCSSPVDIGVDIELF